MTKKPPRPTGPPGPWVLLAAWGPCGYAPVAPGTFGTLGAIPLYLALTRLSPGAYVAFTLAFSALAVVAADRAGRYWRVADASPIVIDEVAGYLLTMALVPFSWPAALAGFVLFRIFDVTEAVARVGVRPGEERLRRRHGRSRGGRLGLGGPRRAAPAPGVAVIARLHAAAPPGVSEEGASPCR